MHFAVELKGTETQPLLRSCPLSHLCNLYSYVRCVLISPSRRDKGWWKSFILLSACSTLSTSTAFWMRIWHIQWVAAAVRWRSKSSFSSKCYNHLPTSKKWKAWLTWVGPYYGRKIAYPGTQFQFLGSGPANVCQIFHHSGVGRLVTITVRELIISFNLLNGYWIPSRFVKVLLWTQCFPKFRFIVLEIFIVVKSVRGSLEH